MVGMGDKKLMILIGIIAIAVIVVAFLLIVGRVLKLW